MVGVLLHLKDAWNNLGVALLFWGVASDASSRRTRGALLDVTVAAPGHDMALPPMQKFIATRDGGCSAARRQGCAGRQLA